MTDNNAKKMIEISEGCDWCGKCATVCPFGAIKLAEDGDIMFRPLSCVAECEVCSLCCPKDAISFSFYGSCGGNCASCGGCSSHKEQ